MNQILAVDAPNQRVIVQPGVINAAGHAANCSQSRGDKRVLIAFEHTDAAGEAVSGIINAGIVPAVEMMDKLAITACEAAAHAGYPLDAGALLLIELDGPQVEVLRQLAQVEAICQRAGATEYRLARTDEERALMWKGRKSALAILLTPRAPVASHGASYALFPVSN